jgi:hypothetical protein
MKLDSLSIDGSALKGLRKSCPSVLFQYRLSEFFGVSQSQISLWETGKRRLRITSRMLSRIPAESGQLREWLIDRGINSLLRKRSDCPRLFGILPEQYVNEHIDEIRQAVAHDLKQRWLNYR